MTVYAPPITAPAAPKPQLALAALIVLAVHALLLLGLPHWARSVPVTGGSPVFQIRTIALASPEPAVAPLEPAAAPPPPQKTKPNPTPVAPVNDQPMPPLHSGTAMPGNSLPLPVLSVSNARPQSLSLAASTDTPTSLLQAPTGANFGGKMPLPPIVPPLPPDQVTAVMQQAVLAQASSAALPAGTPGTPDAIPPVQLPRPAEIIYQTTVTEDQRQTTLPTTINWRYDSQFYDLRWTFYGPAIGDRSRSATGLITARGLTPVTAQALGSDAYSLTFDYAQPRSRGEPVQSIAFGNVLPRPAAQNAMPAASATGQSADAPLPPGVQDPLSLLIQLGALIAGSPSQYPVGSRIALPVANGRVPSPRLIEFTVADDGDFVLAGQFAGQHVPALHLVHEAADDRDARIELWLGKLLDYLPVHLLISQPGGQQLDMTLQSAYTQTVQQRPSPAASAASANDAGGGSGAP